MDVIFVKGRKKSKSFASSLHGHIDSLAVSLLFFQGLLGVP